MFVHQNKRVGWQDHPNRVITHKISLIERRETSDPRTRMYFFSPISNTNINITFKYRLFTFSSKIKDSFTWRISTGGGR